MHDDRDIGDLSNLLYFTEPVRNFATVQDSRLLTLFRVGKLSTGRFEELCLIRNAGVGGVVAHVHLPLMVRQRVRIELSSERQFWGNILWTKDETAGVGFDHPINLDEILDRSETREDDRRSAGPRLNISCSARLRAGSRYYGVRIYDLGQTGAGISAPAALKDLQEVVVTLPGLRPVAGRVAWCRDGRAGIAFNQPIAFGELTHWLQRMFGKPCVEVNGASI